MTNRRVRRAAAWLVLWLGTLFVLAVPCRAELKPSDFPVLSDRVVDDAHLLSPDDAAALIAKLKGLEDSSGIQFVVATVPTLQGEEIEPYANALFRQWHLGQKDKNNGLLFLIAPQEHRARFEVGYGLEGTLTDALSKIILRNAVTPKFKANDFAGGIKAGVDDATAVLTSDKSSWQKRPSLRETQDPPASPGTIFVFLVFGLIVLVVLYRSRRSINWSSAAGGFVGGSMAGGSGPSSSSGPDDSFSGGGGDSGGGGSSDSW